MPLPPPRLVPLPKESTAARLRRAARQQGDLYEKSILNWGSAVKEVDRLRQAKRRAEKVAEEKREECDKGLYEMKRASARYDAYCSKTEPRWPTKYSQPVRTLADAYTWLTGHRLPPL